MRYLFAGGGTGGHIYPALSLAEALSKIDEKAEFVFIGSRRGLEQKIIPRAGYPLETVDIQAFQRKLSFDTLVTVAKAAYSLPKSLAIIRRFRPDVVIGTGGYVSGPPVLAAHWLRVPIVLQEQNALPGVTTRLLLNKASAVLVGYAAAKERLLPKLKGDPNIIKYTGNPIRADITKVSRAEGCARLGLDPAKKTLLVFGASQGSKAINTAFSSAWQQLAKDRSLQVIWQTGEGQYQAIVDKLGLGGFEREPGFVSTGNLQLRAYIHQMPEALAAADLVVARAGAISLAEITVKGLPSILIPLPTAAENHQEYNARALEAEGAAQVILEADLSGETLLNAVQDLLENDTKREKMAAASRKLARPRAAEEGAAIIARIAKRQ
ncbi:MAG: undecaprenyldiphospho-muramoylpentapeptide beta-N-acetylglucosaminyltransferase [Firmicutes bacterium]|nr:undecaprenyldiphospho-muramoylpentapeptide beta-N-acetylglucosaminyltransferase [Bacillota bacterium]